MRGYHWQCHPEPAIYKFEGLIILELSRQLTPGDVKFIIVLYLCLFALPNFYHRSTFETCIFETHQAAAIRQDFKHEIPLCISFFEVHPTRTLSTVQQTPHRGRARQTLLPCIRTHLCRRRLQHRTLPLIRAHIHHMMQRRVPFTCPICFLLLWPSSQL